MHMLENSSLKYSQKVIGCGRASSTYSVLTDGALIRTAAQLMSLLQEEREAGKVGAAVSALEAWQGGPRTSGLIVH